MKCNCLSPKELQDQIKQEEAALLAAQMPSQAAKRTQMSTPMKPALAAPSPDIAQQGKKTRVTSPLAQESMPAAEENSSNLTPGPRVHTIPASQPRDALYAASEDSVAPEDLMSRLQVLCDTPVRTPNKPTTDPYSLPVSPARAHPEDFVQILFCSGLYTHA